MWSRKQVALPAFVGAVVSISAGWLAVPPISSPSSEPRPMLVPLTVDAARVLVDVDGRLLVYNAGERASRMVVRGLRVRAGDAVLWERSLDLPLVGDARYGELNALVERLPEGFGDHHHERRFAPADAPTFSQAEVGDRFAEIRSLLGDLRSEYVDGVERPWIEIPFRVPLGRVFDADAVPGDRARITLELDYEDGLGERRTTTATHDFRRLAPLPQPPPSLAADAGGGLTIHPGDLHVHSCHGEALDACAPSENCAAESFQIVGSFSFAELKSQFQAIGVDWFTSTDHSYCVNDDAEYQVIADELAAISDASFITYNDSELSSDEVGPQSGSDLADLLCLGLTNANHMGAHGISERVYGGEDGFLGFCDGLFTDVLESFVDNIADIRAQGGYPIVHHPASESYAWNSVDELQGIEADMMHGVEIAGGPFGTSGQGGDVAMWVDWLLDGRILYGYSGSDTHDAVFGFAANNVILLDAFTPENLQAAIENGLVYISRDHLLALTVRVAGRTLLMGARQTLPADPPPGTVAEVRAHYDFGADSSEITIFRGVVGDDAETVLCTSGPLTGAGVFSCTDTLVLDASSHYRAYSETTVGSTAAYTNPVFFRR